MYWRLDVDFPLNTKTMVKDTEAVEKIVGKRASDAGTMLGTGLRDVGWVFDDETDANNACKKLKDAGYNSATVTHQID